jgi:hypothetical protein
MDNMTTWQCPKCERKTVVMTMVDTRHAVMCVCKKANEYEKRQHDGLVMMVPIAEHPARPAYKVVAAR